MQHQWPENDDVLDWMEAMVTFAKRVDVRTRIEYVSHAAHCLHSNGHTEQGLNLLFALAEELEQEPRELRFQLLEEAAWTLIYGGGTQEQASRVVEQLAGIASGDPGLEERLDSVRTSATGAAGDDDDNGDDLQSPLDEIESMTSAGVHNAILEELETLATTGDNPCNNVHHWPTLFGEHLRRLDELGEPEAASGYLERAVVLSESLPSSLGWQRAAVFVGLTEIALVLSASTGLVDRLIARANESLAIASGMPDADLGVIQGMHEELFALESQRDTDPGIEIALQTKDATRRRDRLVRLYARSKRWSDVHQILTEAVSETEVLELCWAIRFEISEY